MPTDSTHIDELLRRWDQAREQGDVTTPEALCRECPELLSEVRKRIEDRLETRPLSEASGTVKTQKAEEPPSPTDSALIELEYADLRFHRGGGLGFVYLAQDQRLHRPVALKFIQARYAENLENRDRFLREAEVTARLEHPGVVPVHGIGETATGQLFYSMRFIHGDTFDAAIERFHSAPASNSRQRRMEFRDLLGRLVSVCHTIAYAHNRGIVHRDIKPPNIMLGRFGETLVVDWGLALPVGRDARARASGEQTLLPKSGSQSGASSLGGGTPAYMSPEQADPNAEVGPAADVYSLGVTLYKTLTGLLPYSGTNAYDILQKVKQGVFLPPRHYKPDVPKPLEAICLKAMARLPQDRYVSPLDLARDLEQWLADEPVSAFRERPAQRLARWGRRHKSWVLTGVGSLAVIALIAVFASLKLGSLAQDERSARERGLLFTAKFAARTLANEMDIRWRILEAEANDAELHRLLMQAIEQPENQPLDPALSRVVRDWLDRRARHHDKATKASAWFVTDRQGVLIAVGGGAGDSSANYLGKKFAGRDYFHGQGKDLPDDEGLKAGPIQMPYRSTVYRSKGDKKLKVAFSVPIRGDGPERPVIGILAMSVELGHFGALQTELGANQLAVLVDTRADNVDDDHKTGLVLHHRHLLELQLEGDDQPTFRIGQDFIERLKQFTALRLRQEQAKEQPNWHLASNAATSTSANLERDYHDPTGGPYQGPWLAAYEPVIVKGRSDPKIRDTGWVVIIQERP